MRDLHKHITYRNPESLIGALVLDALDLSEEVEIVKTNDLEVTVKLETTKESERFINNLGFKFDFAPFFYSVNRNISSNQSEPEYIEVQLHTNDKYFYRYSYYLTYEFGAFDEIIENVSKKTNAPAKQQIDDFLVSIDFLPEESTDSEEFSMDREWDIEYNKVVLALDLFEDETRFILFSKYVYYSIASSSISHEKAQFIWRNKALWLEKYNPF